MFGVSSCPFLLNATIRFHLEKYLEENKYIIQHLLCSKYVDNIISCGHNEDEAFHIYTESSGPDEGCTFADTVISFLVRVELSTKEAGSM